jgi:Protein of unknown function (DUF3738)
MRRVSGVLVCVLGLVAALAPAAIAVRHAVAQTSTPERKSFEVASVKECQNNDQPPPSISSPGRLSLGCWPLRRLIEDAYETYGDGKVDVSNPNPPFTPPEGLPQWARQEDVYILTVAQGGPKLRPAEKGRCYDLDPTNLAQPESRDKPWCAVSARPEKHGDLLVADWYGITLDVWVNFVHPNRRNAINRTGLTGRYDIHLEWDDSANPPSTESGMASDPAPFLSLIAAVRSQLGLELKPGKGPQEFFVIDNLEKPTGN